MDKGKKIIPRKQRDQWRETLKKLGVYTDPWGVGQLLRYALDTCDVLEYQLEQEKKKNGTKDKKMDEIE